MSNECRFHKYETKGRKVEDCRKKKLRRVYSICNRSVQFVFEQIVEVIVALERLLEFIFAENLYILKFIDTIKPNKDIKIIYKLMNTVYQSGL